MSLALPTTYATDVDFNDKGFIVITQEAPLCGEDDVVWLTREQYIAIRDYIDSNIENLGE